MAKNGNGTATWIKIGLTLIVIVASVVTYFVRTEVKAVDTKADGITDDVTTLKKDGCDPADTLNLKMVAVEKDVETVKEDIAEFKTEQKAIRADTKEILRRLPK